MEIFHNLQKHSEVHLAQKSSIPFIKKKTKQYYEAQFSQL